MRVFVKTAMRCLAMAALAALLGMAAAAPAAAKDKDCKGTCRPGCKDEWPSGPWKFGVMGDTQWTCLDTNGDGGYYDPDGLDPNSVAVSIIKQVNPQFITEKVRFVIQVGDLTDNGTDEGELSRADAAEQLISAGIGFFPMRGNHETYGDEYGDANNYAIPVFQLCYPQTRGEGQTFGAKQFSSPPSSPLPAAVGSGLHELDGMSYSFDYENARFVIIDPWVTPSLDTSEAGYDFGYSINDQQPWIDSRLDLASRGAQHAFVFSHQPLMAESHQDCPFTGYTNANPDWQNAFYASCQANGVGYYIAGHDHMHQRSIIASPDGKSSVHEMICQSNSSKFYTPTALTSADWFGQKVRETSISQQLDHIGYYIFTVDGPRVTVDYYADNKGGWGSSSAYPGNGGTYAVTPEFTFVKMETWGYSLNGKEFLVPEGKSYTVVQDEFDSHKHCTSTAAILGGTNSNTVVDGNSRPVTQAVNTGWTDENMGFGQTAFQPASDIFSLWGMETAGNAGVTPTYTLSMSWDPQQAPPDKNLTANFGLTTPDANGKWVNVVTLNSGGTAKYVLGPWKASYGLGTYGVDPDTHTAWAVINYNADFAVGQW